MQLHAARVIANAARMSQLINGLLGVARASHGELAHTRVSMATMVEEILSERQARNHAKVHVGPLLDIEADQSSMRQVWENLITNAIKYTARVKAAEIGIECAIREASLVFSVSDNGCGFEPEFAGRLFGVFQRLHPASEYEGMGIGLSLVRRIVERHGGKTWAEGFPNQGATFHFSLPRSRLAPGLDA
jgi:signal transduction histidine kinase